MARDEKKRMSEQAATVEIVWCTEREPDRERESDSARLVMPFIFMPVSYAIAAIISATMNVLRRMHVFNERATERCNCVYQQNVVRQGWKRTDDEHSKQCKTTQNTHTEQLALIRHSCVGLWVRAMFVFAFCLFRLIIVGFFLRHFVRTGQTGIRLRRHRFAAKKKWRKI